MSRGASGNDAAPAEDRLQPLIRNTAGKLVGSEGDNTNHPHTSPVWSRDSLAKFETPTTSAEDIVSGRDHCTKNDYHEAAVEDRRHTPSSPQPNSFNAHMQTPSDCSPSDDVAIQTLSDRSPTAHSTDYMELTQLPARSDSHDISRSSQNSLESHCDCPPENMGSYYDTESPGSTGSNRVPGSPTVQQGGCTTGRVRPNKHRTDTKLSRRRESEPLPLRKQNSSVGPRRVSFTVTRVDEDAGEYVEGLSRCQTPNGRTPSQTDTSRDTSPLPMDSLVVNVPDGGPSDGESSYGDTLTQTSITKLLSKKFNIRSYKTCRYDKNRNTSIGSEGKDVPPQPGFRRRLVSKYESQDYDQIENVLFLREQESLKSLVHRKWMARWLVNLLIGIGTALVATVIEVAIEYGAHYKFKVIKSLVDRCSGGVCLAVPLVVWVTFNAGFVFFGSVLVTFLEPQAAGSGIPQIKCYLNGVKIPGLLSLRALVAKSVGVILSVIGGLACGKEGPMIHSGAIVAAGVSQGRSRVLKKDFKIFEYLRSDTERRDFVSGGAAAGVSAAFGAPVGGVLFSLEEGASFWNQNLTWRIVFASMVATFFVNVLLSAIHGHPADLSNPGLISFGKYDNITYQAIEIPIFLMMAVIGGLSGALFNFMNRKLTVCRKRYVVSRWIKVFEAMMVAVLSALMAFLLVYLVNDCAVNVHDSKHEGTMSEGYLQSYTVLTLSLFAVLYYLLACLTYGLSVSSGVFIPSLLVGATWGRLVGIGVERVFPLMSNNIGKYALIGAACQLGGTVRMTISLTVILIECTGDITFGLPIVMVLIIAKWVGDFFNSGLYDLHIQMMGIPLLPWEPPELSYNITASQVMNKPVIVLRVEESVQRIVDALENMPSLHSGFPVVDHFDIVEDPKCGLYGRCEGLILRSQLVLLLNYKAFLSNECRESAWKKLQLKDFRDAYPQQQASLNVELTESDRKCMIDLRPYMNPTPYTVTKKCSLPRMFRLFRGLGLRHLVVVNDINKVVGMVTRKDLAKYRLRTMRGSMEVTEMHIEHD